MKPSFKKLVLVQFLVGTLAWFAWWLHRTSLYLARPVGPGEEYYAHNWSFQLLVCAVYLIGLLALLAFIVMLESILISAVAKSRQRSK